MGGDRQHGRKTYHGARLENERPRAREQGAGATHAIPVTLSTSAAETLSRARCARRPNPAKTKRARPLENRRRPTRCHRSAPIQPRRTCPTQLAERNPPRAVTASHPRATRTERSRSCACARGLLPSCFRPRRRHRIERDAKHKHRCFREALHELGNATPSVVVCHELRGQERVFSDVFHIEQN